MKDNDTYRLSEMYGEIVGEPVTVIINESTGRDELLTEQLVEALGQQLAVRLIRINKAREKCTHSHCVQQLQKDAQKLIDDIMIDSRVDDGTKRNLNLYGDKNPLVTLERLFNILKI